MKHHSETIADAITVLDGTVVTEAQLRSACIVLAGKALDAADGDWDAVKAMLAMPLEVIGAISYESQPRGPWGAVLKTGSEEAT